MGFFASAKSKLCPILFCIHEKGVLTFLSVIKHDLITTTNISVSSFQIIRLLLRTDPKIPSNKLQQNPTDNPQMPTVTGTAADQKILISKIHGQSAAQSQNQVRCSHRQRPFAWRLRPEGNPRSAAAGPVGLPFVLELPPLCQTGDGRRLGLHRWPPGIRGNRSEPMCQVRVGPHNGKGGCGERERCHDFCSVFGGRRCEGLLCYVDLSEKRYLVFFLLVFWLLIFS